MGLLVLIHAEIEKEYGVTFLAIRKVVTKLQKRFEDLNSELLEEKSKQKRNEGEFL